MGFLSKVWKKVKKVVKGIGKAVKKFAGKIFGSTFGKILLGAIAIYTGGMVLGIFNGPAAIMGAAPGATLKQRFLTEAFQKSLGTAAAAGKTGVSKVLTAVMDTAGATVKGYFGLGEKGVEQGITGDVVADQATGQATAFDPQDNFTKTVLGSGGETPAASPFDPMEGLTKSAQEVGRTPLKELVKRGVKKNAKESVWRRTLQGINDNEMAFYVGSNFLARAMDDSEEQAEKAYRDRWPGGDIGGEWEGAKYGRQHRRSQAANTRRPTLSSLRQEAEEPTAVGY